MVLFMDKMNTSAKLGYVENFMIKINSMEMRIIITT